MKKDLFKNDNIMGNSLIGFEIGGEFKEDEDLLMNSMGTVLNRGIVFSNIDYKLLEPTDNNAVLIRDGKTHIIKTPLYNYYEAVFILPNILEYLKKLKDYKKSYLNVRLGFNKEFVDLSHLNIMKFVLNFNEKMVIESFGSGWGDGKFEKLCDIKPLSLDACNDTVQSQFEHLKYLDESDNVYGIDFSDIKLGYITFKYIYGINYREKWESILKVLNHVVINLYNSANTPDFTDDESEKIAKYNEEFDGYKKIFDNYESFASKYKSIKMSVDLDTDKMRINMVFPSIKDRLFNLVVCSGIKDASVNYDTDVSKIQLKDLEVKDCYHLCDFDIVESELTSCRLKHCDIYDSKVTDSTIIDCNIFGYADYKNCNIKDSFVSRNIILKDCNVSGSLGKMGGAMKGGSLKNTTIIASMAEIGDDVQKENVNEIQ